MVFHKSIPEGGKNLAGEPLELIYGVRLSDELNLKTGYENTYNLHNLLFKAAYHNNQYHYIRDQFEYYIYCRNIHGAYRAGALTKVWLANRKDFLFFRRGRLFLSKEPLTLCP